MRSNQRPFWAIRTLLCGLLSGLLSGRVAEAVVIRFGDGTGNTAAPTDDPGFANVGVRGPASAVYLGNRWVLTAAHVGVGTVQFNGLTYVPEVGSERRLTNSASGMTGLSELTDMKLFRVTEAPALPSLFLSYATPDLGSTVTMIGNGRDRLPTEVFWKVTEVAGDDNDIWAETTRATGAGVLSGFRTADTNTVRWGTNIIGLNEVEVESGWGDVASFQTTFEKSTGLEFEAQGVTGDSGGAVFRKNGPVWEFAGLIHAVSLEENQPGGATTAVFRNDTFIADLSKYAGQLRSIADFGPAPGDFDRDGLLTAADIDLLSSLILGRSPVLHFDLDGNGSVGASDHEKWIELKQTLAGDSDLNGEVAFSDFVSLANNFQKPGGWGQGDFDGNGLIEFPDFVRLANNFGLAFGLATKSAAAASVPEPSAAWLMFLKLLGVASRFRNRRHA